jgi:hypothetical protein
MPECLIPGCEREAHNSMSIRLRRPDTTAIWAPNLDAFLCDVHAVSGGRVEILYEEAESGAIETQVHGAKSSDPHRQTPIRHAAKEIVEDLTHEARQRAAKEAKT